MSEWQKQIPEGYPADTFVMGLAEARIAELEAKLATEQDKVGFVQEIGRMAAAALEHSQAEAAALRELVRAVWPDVIHGNNDTVEDWQSRAESLLTTQGSNQ